MGLDELVKYLENNSNGELKISRDQFQLLKKLSQNPQLLELYDISRVFVQVTIDLKYADIVFVGDRVYIVKITKTGRKAPEKLKDIHVLIKKKYGIESELISVQNQGQHRFTYHPISPY